MDQEVNVATSLWGDLMLARKAYWAPPVTVAHLPEQRQDPRNNCLIHTRPRQFHASPTLRPKNNSQLQPVLMHRIVLEEEQNLHARRSVRRSSEKGNHKLGILRSSGETRRGANELHHTQWLAEVQEAPCIKSMKPVDGFKISIPTHEPLMHSQRSGDDLIRNNRFYFSSQVIDNRVTSVNQELVDGVNIEWKLDEGLNGYANFKKHLQLSQSGGSAKECLARALYEGKSLASQSRKDLEKQTQQSYEQQTPLEPLYDCPPAPMLNKEQIFHKQEGNLGCVGRDLSFSHRSVITNRGNKDSQADSTLMPARFGWREVEYVLSKEDKEQYLNLEPVADLLDTDALAEVLKWHGRNVSVARTLVIRRDVSFVSAKRVYKPPPTLMHGQHTVDETGHGKLSLEGDMNAVLASSESRLQRAYGNLRNTLSQVASSTLEEHSQSNFSDVEESSHPKLKDSFPGYKRLDNVGDRITQVTISSDHDTLLYQEEPPTEKKFRNTDEFSPYNSPALAGISVIQPRADEYHPTHDRTVDASSLSWLSNCKDDEEAAKNSEQEDNSGSDASSLRSESECSQTFRDKTGRTCVDKVRKHHQRPREKPNHCLHLWEFLRDLLRNEAYSPNYIAWTQKEQGEFRLIKTEIVASLWGQSKNRRQMTYEKMARAMRYYYKLKILEKVPNKRLHFRFGKKILKKVIN